MPSRQRSRHGGHRLIPTRKGCSRPSLRRSPTTCLSGPALCGPRTSALLGCGSRKVLYPNRRDNFGYQRPCVRSCSVLSRICWRMVSSSRTTARESTRLCSLRRNPGPPRCVSALIAVPSIRRLLITTIRLLPLRNCLTAWRACARRPSWQALRVPSGTRRRMRVMDTSRLKFIPMIASTSGSLSPSSMARTATPC